LFGQDAPDFVEIPPMPGREIVQSDDPLSCPQQRLDQVRTDEASGPGDQPGRPRPRQFIGKIVARNGQLPSAYRLQ